MTEFKLNEEHPHGSAFADSSKTLKFIAHCWASGFTPEDTAGLGKDHGYPVTERMATVAFEAFDIDYDVYRLSHPPCDELFEEFVDG